MMDNKENKELNNYIGEKIKQYRLAAKMTQKQLGKKIQKSANTISNYETGIIAPSQDALFALADALNVSVNSFFPLKNNSITLNQNTEDDFADKLMVYIKSLDESKRAVLISNIQLAVEIFKKSSS